ncbi:hypothetical protein [Streptomyces luteolifulvus]|jgi:hypothetical protein|nr:hypothetical protein [Streptomyces luteolifulvus]
MTDVTVSAEAVEEAQPAGLKPDALDDQSLGAASLVLERCDDE